MALEMIAEGILDPLTGIATSGRILHRDPGSPTIFTATVQMADTKPYLGHRGDAYNSGAGLSEQEAWNAAIGEAVERYSVSVQRPEKMVFGSWEELQPLNPLHPVELALFADFQQDSLPREPFSITTSVRWMPGVSLVTQRPRLVPACLVHIPYHQTCSRDVIIGPAISTGLACGCNFEAALISGLYECVERDAVAIAWLNRLSLPRLVLDEAWAEELMEERFARPNLEYNLYVLEFDVCAPTVVCLIRDWNFSPPLLCIGGACRLDVRDAAVKALVESVQGWNWARYLRLEHGSLPTPSQFDRIQSFESRVKLYACASMNEAVSFLLETPQKLSLSSYPRVNVPREQAIDMLVGQLGATDTDVIALELTAPEIEPTGMRVVKVYCPGLQQLEGDHRYRLLGGQRWRDTPVRMGYRLAPLAAASLNPFPHPYP